eukprot:6175039-Pleurochrysis_carterae.AAC.1
MRRTEMAMVGRPESSCSASEAPARPQSHGARVAIHVGDQSRSTTMAWKHAEQRSESATSSVSAVDSRDANAKSAATMAKKLSASACAAAQPLSVLCRSAAARREPPARLSARHPNDSALK